MQRSNGTTFNEVMYNLKIGIKTTINTKNNHRSRNPFLLFGFVLILDLLVSTFCFRMPCQRSPFFPVLYLRTNSQWEAIGENVLFYARAAALSI